MSQARYLAKIAPGLAKLLHYLRSDLSHELPAGLSVAAVALPVGVAYVQLAGFNPAVGLYSSIVPLLAYAIFGTSRQLLVGPDAATWALVPAAVAPLASGDQNPYESLSTALALLAGVLCIGANFPVTHVDTSGLCAVEQIADTLRERGVILAAAGRQTEWRLWAESRRRAPKDRQIPIYPYLREVVRVYQSMQTV